MNKIINGALLMLAFSFAGAQSANTTLTPELRKSIDAYTMQVAKKTCSNNRKTDYRPFAMSKNIFNTLIEAAVKGLKSAHPKARVVYGINADLSGYIYVDESALHSTGLFYILVAQTKDKNNAGITTYACELNM